LKTLTHDPISHIARVRQHRPDAFQSVDLSDALDEIRPSPGVRYLVREF